MKKNVQPILLLMLLLLGLVLLLAACVEQTAEAPMPTSAPTAEPTAEPTSAPTAIPTETPTAVPTETPTAEPTAEPVKEVEIVKETPKPTPTPEPTPTPAPTPTPVPTPFSIVWMSDTKNLSRRFPEVFNSMRDWILENRETENIVFVAHTGDVVDGISQTMWSNAADALVPVFETIPGMIVSGNHDISSEKNQALFYKRPYAQAVMKEGQIFEKGEAAYATFEAGGDEFLVFGIGFAVRSPKLRRWVAGVMEQHPDAIVLFVVHSGLQEDGRLSAQGQDVFDSSVTINPNARLLLCGHQHGTLLRTDWLDDDGDGEAERSFTSMMFNYQDDYEDGLGYLRILTFYPEDRRIEVKTYSPWLDRWGYVNTPPEEDAFTLENAY